MYDASKGRTDGENVVSPLNEECVMKHIWQRCDLRPLTAVGGVAAGELKNLSCATYPASHKNALPVAACLQQHHTWPAFTTLVHVAQLSPSPRALSSWCPRCVGQQLCASPSRFWWVDSATTDDKNCIWSALQAQCGCIGPCSWHVWEVSPSIGKKQQWYTACSP